MLHFPFFRVKIKEVTELSLERVIKALTGLGLSRLDAELYVYITKKGPQKIDDLVQAFNIVKHKLNSNAQNLQNKKLVVCV